jgi:6-phosphogluconate dehydrogenase
MKNHRLIIVMGVSGSGKSTIGRALASRLDIDFYDGDDFHPASNVQKMASGQPLNDQDRLPWLEAINAFAKEKLQDTSIIVACSALKDSYRDLLSKDIDTVFIYLKGNAEEIIQRLSLRKNHFMPAKLLESQFQALEEPSNAIVIPINQSIAEIIEQSADKLVY